MADTKRGKKTRTPPSSSKKFKRKTGQENKKKWKKGPNLPNSLKKVIESLPQDPKYDDDEEEQDVSVKEDVDIKSDEEEDVGVNDFYEYDEQIPQEELMKNRRYDDVDNNEYQLPDDFEDEDVASDDDIVNGGSKKRDSDDDDEEAFDDEKHSKMLQHITKLPGAAFEGKKKNDVVVYEAYPESEYNPSRDVLDGDGRITIDDLLNPLHGKPGFSKIRKDVQRMGRKSMSIQPPLPKPQQEKIDRKTTYAFTKERLTDYNPQVKKNREATTMYFNEDVNLGYNTVGAIAAEFKPRTEFEKKMAAIVNAKDITDAHSQDGAKLLELNKVSVEDVKERQDRLAKMRNLLFRHEVKAKRIKNIKSKTYRRLSKKDRLKAAENEAEMNPDDAKELAEKEEFRRAEERLTLKHKNTSKWAKRIKKRGFDIQDDGTRAAISEQLQQHALLTRKRNSMHDDDSSDDSSEDEDEDISEDEDDASKLKLLERGKKRTLEVLGEDDDEPKSGVLSLPFMVRGQKKKKEAADEEARLALQEFESSLKQLEGDDDTKDHISSVGGRKTFGIQKKQAPKPKVKAGKDNYFDNSDSEDDADAIQEDVNDKHGRQAYAQKDATVDTNILREDAEVEHDSLFKSFEDIAKDSGPKIEYDVSLVTTKSSKKKKNKKQSKQVKSENKSKDKKPQVTDLASNKDTEIEHGDDDNDTDSEVQMIDGVITTGADYELPSQDDLIKSAFAGDDVEGDFEMIKQKILNEENPEPEAPLLLPGWGQWTRVQKKRGPPAWMLAEHERAKKKRAEALKKRPDAHLKHVIISEKVDKKAEKLQIKSLPFPFKDKEHFERSNRMPLGPEFNPATTVGLLNRPEVVKRPGVSIRPIKLRKK